MDPFELMEKYTEDIELADIEMIRIALETGPYEAKKKADGLKRLNDIYRRLSEKAFPEAPSLSVPLQTPSPVSNSSSASQELSDEKIRSMVSSRLSIIRVASSSLESGIRSLLSSFAGKTPLDVLCLCADLFANDEFNSVLSWLQLGEDALNKYWAILDKKSVARHQLFSEDFFILHYNELNTSTVLKNGKNPWRKKEAMSTKLAMFLKLKGVSI
jgi:hypothetical protein